MLNPKQKSWLESGSIIDSAKKGISAIKDLSLPGLSLNPSQLNATVRWANTENKVNNAVNVLARNGLSYSINDGIVGNFKNASKSETRKITAAGKTMGNLEASYYPSGKKNNNGGSTTTPRAAHYEPMSLGDYELVQEKALTQSKTSMHLRATQQFIQRINFAPRFQVHPNRELLGISAEESQNWSSRTESLWRQDRELKDWSEDLKNSYDQIADIAKNQYLSIGEFFAVNRSYFENPEHTTNLSVELFHPIQIQSPRFAYGNYVYNIKYHNCDNIIVETSYKEFLNTIEPNGNYIEKGIEYNKKGQEIALFIAPTSFGEPYIRVPFKNKNGFVQVLHGFIQKEPGEKRGLPDSAYGHHEFMNTRDLERYEMQTALVNSTISGSVTADSNAQPGGNQGGVTDMGNKAGWNTIDNVAVSDYEEPGYSVREVNGGGYILQNFTPGYKYTEHNTSRPNLNIPLFSEKILDYTLPATYGVANSLVSQKLAGSYNASKGIIDLSWKTGIEYYLKQFSSDFHRPLYGLWLNGKIATGAISAPKWEIPELRNAWSSMSVITPAKPSLNPLQEAKASGIKIALGASTGEHEAQQLTGTSFNENIDRLENENIKMKKAFPVEESENDTKGVDNA